MLLFKKIVLSTYLIIQIKSMTFKRKLFLLAVALPYALQSITGCNLHKHRNAEDTNRDTTISSTKKIKEQQPHNVYQKNALTSDENNLINSLKEWKAGTIVTASLVKAYGEDKCFSSFPISHNIYKRIEGKSYKKGCNVPLTDLCYLRILHYNAEGKLQLGEMICNKLIANDLIAIFRTLYINHYRIERMVLVDAYNANDELSMQDNNTTCFNFRRIKGKSKLSKHSLGLAVDINPLYNPHVKYNNQNKMIVAPQKGLAYANRNKHFPYKIDASDLCYKLFKQHGFRWGGAWRHSKDYQHFEK